METKVKIIEWSEVKRLKRESFNHQQDSKEQGQGHGTCEVKSAVPMMSTIMSKHGKLMEEMENFSMCGCRINISVKSCSA